MTARIQKVMLRVALAAVFTSLAFGTISLAQTPEPVPMPPDAIPIGPVPNFLKLFGYIQVVVFGLGMLMRFLPQTLVPNVIIPRFKYVLFFLTNMVIGATAFGKEAGWVTVGDPSGVALAGFGFGMLGILKSLTLAVVQLKVNRVAWEDVWKVILPKAVLEVGKKIPA